MAKFIWKPSDATLKVLVKPSKDEKINERELDFFSRKYIRGLFRLKLKKSMFSKELEYEGSNGVSLYWYLLNPISKEAFLRIIAQIIDVVKRMRLQLLPIEKIVWSENCIIFSESLQELQFLYLPFEQVDPENQLIALLQRIVRSVKFQNPEDMRILTPFNQIMYEMSAFDETALEQLFATKYPELLMELQNEHQGRSEYMTSHPESKYLHEQQKREIPYPQNISYQPNTSYQNYQQPPYEEATTLLQNEEYEGATTLLSDNDPGQPYLYRVRSNEQIRIYSNPFRIGKEQAEVEYCLNGNQAVSRVHAEIVQNGNQYYLVDRNSTNHTYLNEQQIPAQTGILLSNGDQIRIADETFLFYR